MLYLDSHYGWVPYDVADTSSTGQTTREASRTLEVRRSATDPNVCPLIEPGLLCLTPVCF